MYDFEKAPSISIKRLSDMVRVLSPKLHSVRDNADLKNFVVDSRQVGEGDVFIAIKGARRDGHEFVENAFARGAAACLVEREDKVHAFRNCIMVENAVNALGFLAAAHRRGLDTKIIALTGSVGKTTTKEMLFQIFSLSHHTCKSEGNLNNTIGLPTQILRLTENDAYMIAEMGMSTPGEIATLMKIAKPDVGLWTSVHAVHQANFPNLDAIAQAKAELVTHLGDNKLLVYNGDNVLVTKYCQPYHGRHVVYGFRNPGADVKARIEPFPDWSGCKFDVFLKKNGRKIPLQIPLVGRYNVKNALAACATAISQNVPINDIATGLKMTQNIPGRSRLFEFDRDVKLVDDTYNSNPQAVYQVMRSFAPLSYNNYRWLILGDMRELGPDEVKIHASIGRLIGRYGFDRISFIGPLSVNAYEALKKEQPDTKVHLEHFSGPDEAIDKMEVRIPPHARIWLKASRGIQLERLASSMVESLSAVTGPV